MTNFKLARRGMLGALATAGGGLLLQSLATGIPASVLLAPLSARGGDLPKAKTLILSVSGEGDPINANVPGTFDFPADEVFHSSDPRMEKSTLLLAGKTFTAAKPWADLPQEILDRTAFFHHATYTPVHGELGLVQRMMNATEKNDMLVSLIARETAPLLGCVQADPLSLGANGSELLSTEGRVLGNVAPLSVRKALGGVDGPLQNLAALRDQHVDRLYDIYRQDGTPSQRRLLDAWVRSRDEARSIAHTLIERLETIDGNDAINQVKCAAVLAAMNIAPVITLHLGFGGDNHNDEAFETETEETLASIAALRTLIDDLDDLELGGHLKQGTIVGTLNVFGRTLKRRGTSGRDHHPGHHVMVLIGNGIKGGVVGGLELDTSGEEYVATSIDSATGSSGGDIPFEETLGAAGKTLARAAGVPNERVDSMVQGGKAVESILS